MIFFNTQLTEQLVKKISHTDNLFVCLSFIVNERQNGGG